MAADHAGRKSESRPGCSRAPLLQKVCAKMFLKQPVELSTGRRFENGLVCRNSSVGVSLSAAPSMWV